MNRSQPRATQDPSLTPTPRGGQSPAPLPSPPQQEHPFDPLQLRFAPFARCQRRNEPPGASTGGRAIKIAGATGRTIGSFFRQVPRTIK